MTAAELLLGGAVRVLGVWPRGVVAAVTDQGVTWRCWYGRGGWFCACALDGCEHVEAVQRVALPSEVDVEQARAVGALA